MSSRAGQALGQMRSHDPQRQEDGFALLRGHGGWAS
jgi:hypothetical protein